MELQRVFAVRGAITVEENSVDSILTNTTKLMEELISENDLSDKNVISAIFTVTKDLNACYPAKAARDLGWTNTALMCANEIEVPNGLDKCVRVMVHYYADSDHEPSPIYLKNATKLRPDLNTS